MRIWQKLFSRESLKKKDNQKTAALPVVMLLLFACSFIAALLFGSTGIRIDEAIQALISGDTAAPAYRILFHLRLPRACAAVLAGSALAVSGVIIQAVLHNAMAAPNIIGVNSGAGLAAILMIAVAPSAIQALPVAAFLGAVIACLCIYGIASRTGAGRITITLVGIAISSILNAGINTVKTVFPDSIYDANAFMIGGISGVTFTRLTPAWGLILVGIALSIFLARDVDILSLGDETAAGLGMHVKGMKLALLMLASVLAGSAVSFAGLLGFVGLVVPHIVRRFVGNKHRALIPLSAVGGAILVLLCDLLGRVLVAPYELPVGIILSFIGGPFFIALILVQRKRDAHD